MIRMRYHVAKFTIQYAVNSMIYSFCFVWFLKLIFERCLQWLRAGVIPVGVVEGKPPLEKLELLRKRWGIYNTYIHVPNCVASMIYCLRI